MRISDIVVAAGVVAMISIPPANAQSPRPPTEASPPSDRVQCPPGIRPNASPSETTGEAGATQFKGVVCPPAGTDPGLVIPPLGGGKTPIVPPPGTPGGDPGIEPR